MPFAEQLIPSDELVRWNNTLNVYTQCNLRLAWKLVPCVDLLSKNTVDSLVLKGQPLHFRPMASSPCVLIQTLIF